MEQLEKFRATLAQKELVSFLVVPSFVAHYVSAEILPSLIYKRPGIRSIQWIDSELSIYPSVPPHTEVRKFNLLSQVAMYKIFLRQNGKKFKSSEAMRPGNFRAILLNTEAKIETVFHAFQNKDTEFKMEDLLFFHAELNYSSAHVSFSEALKKLHQSLVTENSGEKEVSSDVTKSSKNLDWDKFGIHSFEQVGHIAHLNLPWECEENFSAIPSFKFILGGLLLDHHPQIAIVLNKKRKIESQFREMDMEVLAARPPVTCVPAAKIDSYCLNTLPSEGWQILPSITKAPPEKISFVLSHKKNLKIREESTGEIYIQDDLPSESEIYFAKKIKHNDCRFSFSFLSCFFNKRLEEEHRKMKQMLTEKNRASHVVFDVFAGVGPMSIPIAVDRRKVKLPNSKIGVVHANDLNPECYRSLSSNICLNKLKDSDKLLQKFEAANLYVDSNEEPAIYAWNMDGAEFIERALSSWKQHRKDNTFCHFLMNLPGSAVESFLYPFSQYFQEASNSPTLDGVIVHVYTFVDKSPDLSNPEAAKKVYDALCPPNTLTGLETFVEHYLISPPYTVRYVSPSKQMARVSFTLSPATASAFLSR